ncbi:14642_t:CDS:2, partial [Funneliformis mosseae]
FNVFQKYKKDNQKDNAIEWIENAIKNEKVKLILFNDLINSEELGSGGFGCIRKATWIKTRSCVVYKRLTNIEAIKGNILNAFIHELQIHLCLDSSDRIVRCLDQNTKDFLLIMQYANGGDLQNYLEKNHKNLTWENKKKLAFQIAEGLNYLHNENILHRDLHSKNIVIHNGNAKITDFGISKNMNTQNSINIIGTFGRIPYVDPKKLLDLNYQYTKFSDIYSYGVLMWEISSEVPPFKNIIRNEEHLLRIEIIKGVREKAIEGTPKIYEDLYKKCWDSTPEKRPRIRKILEEFKKMGFGIDVMDDSTYVNLDPKEMEINVKNTSTEVNNDLIQANQSISLDSAMSETHYDLNSIPYSL